MHRATYIMPFLAVVLFLTTAYNSSGFIQADEHYQLIEFANYKLGRLPVDKLAWEFPANARPGLQPFICYVLFKTLSILGITDVYQLAFLLRAITAIFSLVVILFFVNAFSKKLDEDIRPWFAFFSFFLWFLPYLDVRFTSETWCGMFLMLSLVGNLKCESDQGYLRYFIIGLLLGVSFLFKYQAALFAVGYILWIIAEKSHPSRIIFRVIPAFMASVAVGILVDYWLYGKFTLSFVNYFNVNLIKGVASNFGTSPPYQYVLYILTAPGPYGILILGSFIALWRLDSKNATLWTISPYLVVHSFIPHKELRFLFPLANLCPLIFFLAVQKLRDLKFRVPISAPVLKFGMVSGIALALAVDIAGLVAVSTTGPGPGVTPVTEFIHKRYNNPNTHIIEIGNVMVYYDRKQPWNSFYNSNGLNVERVTSVWQADFIAHMKPGCRNVVVIGSNDMTGVQTLHLLKKLGLSKVFQNIPDITSLIFQLYNPGLNDGQIFVYEFGRHLSKDTLNPSP